VRIEYTHIPRYLRTWLVPSPRSIGAVLFESVRRFRASLLPHTTCVRSWRSLFVRTIFVCTVPPGTILIPIEFTVLELWQLVVLSACRIFLEGFEFVENFLERVESNRTSRKKKKKKQRRGKKKTTQRNQEVRFRASLLLHATCVGSWCNWCADCVAAKHFWKKKPTNQKPETKSCAAPLTLSIFCRFALSIVAPSVVAQSDCNRYNHRCRKSSKLKRVQRICRESADHLNAAHHLFQIFLILTATPLALQLYQESIQNRQFLICFKPPHLFLLHTANHTPTAQAVFFFWFLVCYAATQLQLNHIRDAYKWCAVKR